MGSGKTTALNVRVKQGVAIFVGNPVRTHNMEQETYRSYLVFSWEKYLEELPALCALDKVTILFDEVQFAPKHVIDHIQKYSKYPNLHFICAMLDKDSDGKTWANFDWLGFDADEIMYHRGVCGLCGGKSTHTRLRVSVQSSKGCVLEGGMETYIPLCWSCFMSAAINYNLPPDPYK
jgi:thymidine kinase